MDEKISKKMTTLEKNIPFFESAQQTTKAAQNWLSDHKMISLAVGAAALYFLGTRRIQKIAGYAIKSGLAAVLANTLLNEEAVSTKTTDNSIYH
jgi:uncharacterized membrane protein YebE (DUF533 family)